jgi:hypothetical protein
MKVQSRHIKKAKVTFDIGSDAFHPVTAIAPKDTQPATGSNHMTIGCNDMGGDDHPGPEIETAPFFSALNLDDAIGDPVVWLCRVSAGSNQQKRTEES